MAATRHRSTELTSPVLRSGDLVAVVSPSGSPTNDHLQDTVNELEGWGLRVSVGKHAADRHGIMAGTDSARLEDLNTAFNDPAIRAVFASRGGAGAYRIANEIDFAAVRKDPKPLVGFSDITNLHASLWVNTGLATIHGCVGRNQVADDVRRLLTTTGPLTVNVESSLPSASLTVHGTAEGILAGGNLREFAGCVGAGLPALEGLLFLEDLRHVGIGQVDRNLTQLLRSGTLDRVTGIVLGLFAGFEDYVDQGWTVLDVLKDRLAVLGVPILGGIKAGHGGLDENGNPDQRAIVLGAHAILDTQDGTLTMNPAVH